MKEDPRIAWAKTAYVLGKIDIGELESQVANALRTPIQIFISPPPSLVTFDAMMKAVYLGPIEGTA